MRSPDTPGPTIVPFLSHLPNSANTGPCVIGPIIESILIGQWTPQSSLVRATFPKGTKKSPRRDTGQQKESERKKNLLPTSPVSSFPLLFRPWRKSCRTVPSLAFDPVEWSHSSHFGWERRRLVKCELVRGLSVCRMRVAVRSIYVSPR